MLELIQKVLNEYDKVFLIADKSVYAGSDWERFCNVIQAMEKKSEPGELFKKVLLKKILLIIEEGVEYDLSFPHVVLSHQETWDLWKLYMTYEFSDRFSVFPDGGQYGTVFGYSDAGILTEQEAVMAILGYRKGIEDGQITL